MLAILQSLTDSGVLAANSLQFDQRTIESIASFLVLVLAWSVVRPNMIRDYDNRVLPSNPTARFAFSFACAIAFVSLAFAYKLFIGAAEDILTATIPQGKGFFENFKDQPAMLAVITLGGMLQFSIVTDLERSFIIWLHSRSQTGDDLEQLRRHLENGPFSPTAGELRRNREIGRRHGIYLTDKDFDRGGTVKFHQWRRASTLLHFVRDWNDVVETRVLTFEDMRRLSELENSLERKMKLIMSVLKMGEGAHVRHGGGGEQSQQASVPLEEVLGPFEEFLQVEYRILLEQVTLLAARSVVLSGDKASDLLEQLSAAGFSGLGRIQQFSFDHILWMFLVVSLGGFLVMYLGYTNTVRPSMAEGLARFAFAMSIAGLIGTAIGSRRFNARAVSTPWHKYLQGGIFAGVAFITVSILSNSIKEAMGIPQPEGQPPFSVYRMLPWALLPCLTTMAIARLARIPHWPAIPMPENYNWLYERTLDGICVSLALYVAYCVAFSLHPLMGIELSPNLKALADKAWLPIPILWSVQALGFLIGFTVVLDARLAAHSTILALEGRSARPERRPSTVPSQLRAYRAAAYSLIVCLLPIGLSLVLASWLNSSSMLLATTDQSSSAPSAIGVLDTGEDSLIAVGSMNHTVHVFAASTGDITTTEKLASAGGVDGMRNSDFVPLMIAFGSDRRPIAWTSGGIAIGGKVDLSAVSVRQLRELAGSQGTARNWQPANADALPFAMIRLADIADSFAIGRSDGSIEIDGAPPLPADAPRHGSPVTALAAGKGGSFASAAADGSVVLWRNSGGTFTPIVLASSASIKQPAGADNSCGACSSVSFSKDGSRVVAAGSNGKAFVWDVASGQPLVTVDHGAAINVVRLTSAGTTLLTAGDDGASNLWDIDTQRDADGKERVFAFNVATIRGHGEAVTHAELLAGDSKLVTAARDGTIRLTSLFEARILGFVPLKIRPIWLPISSAVRALMASGR